MAENTSGMNRLEPAAQSHLETHVLPTWSLKLLKEINQLVIVASSTHYSFHFIRGSLSQSVIDLKAHAFNQQIITEFLYIM